jgi:hypothetical protein
MFKLTMKTIVPIALLLVLLLTACRSTTQPLPTPPGCDHCLDQPIQAKSR